MKLTLKWDLSDLNGDTAIISGMKGSVPTRPWLGRPFQVGLRNRQGTQLLFMSSGLDKVGLKILAVSCSHQGTSLPIHNLFINSISCFSKQRSRRRGMFNGESESGEPVGATLQAILQRLPHRAHVLHLLRLPDGQVRELSIQTARFVSDGSVVASGPGAHRYGR